MIKMKLKSVNISGFGGSYEEGCQQILWLGLEWIKDKPLEIWKGTYSLENVTGLLVSGDGLKEFDKILYADPFLKAGGITGAMHQCSLSFVHYIHLNGYEAFVKKVEETSRLIEVDREITPELAKWLGLEKEE